MGAKIEIEMIDKALMLLGEADNDFTLVRQAANPLMLGESVARHLVLELVELFAIDPNNLEGQA